MSRENKNIIVDSVKHLIELIDDGHNDYFIMLGSGAFRSSKNINYDDNTKIFDVYNDIDGSEQDLTEAQLYSESNIGEAIDKKALICEIY